MLIVPRSLVTRRLASGGRPVRPEESENRFTYDAFISYSRAADGDLARVLQHGLHTFAKPWYRLRALRVFRDEGSLAAGSQLWGSLQEAMDASHFFVLLACEQSARAPWVEQEVAYWCTHRGIENLVIVLTDPPADGSRQPPGMAWDEDLGDFDWQRTTALPRCLKGRFRQEPNAVLLGRARTKPELSLRDPEFRTAVATLAAPLRGVPKDRLIGEDVRQYRRTRRHVLLTIAGLAALVVFAAFSAVQQRDTARDQTALAEGRQYAALSRNASDPYTALAYAIAAEQRAAPHLSEARGAFAEAVRGLDAWEARLVGEVPAKAVFDTTVRWSRDGSQIWVADREGGWVDKNPSHSVVDSLPGVRAPSLLAFSPGSGERLASASGNTVALWDLGKAGPTLHRHGARIVDGATVEYPPPLSVSGDGQVAWSQETSEESPSTLHLWSAGKDLPSNEEEVPYDDVALSPDGNTLYAVSNTGLAVWKKASGALRKTAAIPLPEHRDTLGRNRVAYGQDGRAVVLTTDGAVLTFDPRAGKLSTALPGTAPRLSDDDRKKTGLTEYTMTLSEHGALAAIASGKGTVPCLRRAVRPPAPPTGRR
ncbi:toll/interleukin-1 receptor domain-containing protein [Streptomyces sp. NPDC058287]|uniref:toll/interleukin-1 receptor domain-containing protein n=1 Tax=unclassified Streptomyces TaxID=2593676 RepID=UPI0036E68A25